MRIIIAGSRGVTDKVKVITALTMALEEWKPREVTEIISGGARGVDTLAEELANEYKIAFREYPADWDKYGKRAGYLRNEQMADAADGLVLVWDGESRGSKHMLDIAKRKGLKVHVHRV